MSFFFLIHIHTRVEEEEGFFSVRGETYTVARTEEIVFFGNAYAERVMSPSKAREGISLFQSVQDFYQHINSISDNVR